MLGALGPAAVGARRRYPPSRPREASWLLGPSGRAAGKGRSCEWEELEEVLIYPAEYPRGRAGQAQADTHGQLPRGVSQPPTPPPIPRAPTSQPEGDASPKLGPREVATAGAGGAFPSA